MKILLDENVDPRLASHFPDEYEITSVLSLARGVGDEQWLRWAVQNGFSVFVTGDTNLPHQQNLTSFEIAVVWFEGPPNTLEGIRPHMSRVNELLPRAIQENRTIRVQEEKTTLTEVEQE